MFPILLRYNWYITLLKVYNIMIWSIYLLQNDYHNNILVVNILHLTYLYVFFLYVNFKIYSLSNFQIYNTQLLTLVTMVYITSQNIYFITGSLCCLTTFTPFPLTLASDQSDLCFFKFSFYRFHLFVFSLSDSFHLT